MRIFLGFAILLIIAAAIFPFVLMRGMTLVTPYKTQTILYRSIEDPGVTIEFQMKDVGAILNAQCRSSLHFLGPYH